MAGFGTEVETASSGNVAFIGRLILLCFSGMNTGVVGGDTCFFIVEVEEDAGDSGMLMSVICQLKSGVKLRDLCCLEKTFE